jgi:hypothetical protein
MINEKESKLKRIFAWEHIPFIILGCYFFILHFRLNAALYGDDVWFYNTFTSGGYNLFTYLSWRYSWWTSRMIIEAIEIAGVCMPVLLWKVLNTAVIVSIGVFLSKIFVREEHRLEGNIVIVSLMLLYTYNDVLLVGVVSGSANYFWPVAFGLIAIYPLRKMADGKRIRGYEYCLYAISLLIGSNQEQMCIILLAVYLAYAVFMLVRKKVRPFIFVQLGLAIFSLVMILTCPGNASRVVQETATWLPQYSSFTFLQKIQLGVSGVLAKIFLTNNKLFLGFTFVVLFMTWQKSKKLSSIVVASIPLLLLIASSALYPAANRYEILQKLFGAVKPDGIIGTGASLKAHLAFFGMLFACGCMLVSVYMLPVGKTRSRIALGIVLIGLATKAAMGFSPTVWGSGERTAFFLMVAIIACTVYLLNWWDFSKKSGSQLLLLLLVLWGVYGGVANMVP